MKQLRAVELARKYTDDVEFRPKTRRERIGITWSGFRAPWWPLAPAP